MAEVDRRRRALERKPHRVVEARRDAVRAAEILTGPGGKDRQLDARARDPVHDLVQRAVAADDDEQVVIRGSGARELDQIAWALGQEHLAAKTECLGARVQGWPTLAGLSVSASRID